MPKFILVIFFFLITYTLRAQTWELGVGLGGAGYMGDLNLNNPLKVSGPSASFFVKRNFNGYLALKAEGTAGSISGADSTSSNAQFRQRNLSFTTPLYEGSLMAEFNFMNYIPQVGRNKFTPYFFLGVAAVGYFPSAVYDGQKYDLRGYKTENEKTPYSTVAIGFPYGAGIKYNFAGSFTVGIELGYRNPNTDYLDDVSGKYPFGGHSTIQEQLSDPSGEKTGVFIGEPGEQRGDGNPRDTYFFTQITLSFTFISQKCYFQN